MLARKIILGFGLAMLLPMVIHQGVEVIRPMPQYQRHQIPNYYQTLQRASDEEKPHLQAEQQRLNAEWGTAQKRWSKSHFFAGVGAGIATTLIGSFVAAPAVAGGLMLGGIFSFLGGCGFYWLDLNAVGRLGVLLAGFLVLLWIGYRRLSDPKQGSAVSV
ncbi:MAG: hypothetical protein HY211_06870 [Candidatus Omnitrophica bacterium]|nr:hypothetical protein [Candidatus Omnitrophota bacterium]